MSFAFKSEKEVDAINELITEATKKAMDYIEELAKDIPCIDKDNKEHHESKVFKIIMRTFEVQLVFVNRVGHSNDKTIRCFFSHLKEKYPKWFDESSEEDSEEDKLKELLKALQERIKEKLQNQN